MKKKSLQVNDLKVKSFITDAAQNRYIKGGDMESYTISEADDCGSGGSGGSGGASNSCEPNRMYTHEPCATYPAHCNPCM